MNTEHKMATFKIGTTFARNSQWHQDEINLVANIESQINRMFPTGNNLLINTTWFGPQFDNGEYIKLSKFRNVDRLFFLASVDPVMLNRQQLDDISAQVGAKETYYIGNFDTDLQFTFIATLLPKYFQNYTTEDLLLKDIKWQYIAYNRKPRPHRTELVDKLYQAKLDAYGIITLGTQYTLQEKIQDYAAGNWGMPDEYGIPHDIHSLGRLDIWQNHFLTVVGETEFNPWDNMFITEKTWKPILGLRPFLINGQTKIYKYLRDNGFRTFTHYFDVELENVREFEVHDSIVKAIQSMSTLDLKDLYSTMLPDLQHNRERFSEFVREQKTKIADIFNE